MPSIIDSIHKAEEQAAQIRQQAAEEGRVRYAEASARRDALLEEARGKARDLQKESVERAKRDAAQAAAEIRGDAARAADEACRRARENLPQAVAYIVERVVKA